MTNILFISYGYSKLKSKLRKEEKKPFIVKKWRKWCIVEKETLRNPLIKIKLFQNFNWKLKFLFLFIKNQINPD